MITPAEDWQHLLAEEKQHLVFENVAVKVWEFFSIRTAILLNS